MEEDEADLELSQALARKIDEAVISHGHAVIGVFDTDPPFAYTAGRCVTQRAELYINGLPQTLMARLLNEISDKEIAGEINLERLSREDKTLDGFLQGDYRLAVREVSPAAAHMNAALLMGADRAYQIMWPDVDHNYPTDDGWSGTSQIAP